MLSGRTKGCYETSDVRIIIRQILIYRNAPLIFWPLHYLFFRTRRDEQSPPNQLYYAEIERPTSDIAAFHIDR